MECAENAGGGDMTEPIITEAELFKELDAFRKSEVPKLQFTDEQFRVVNYARSGKNKVNWANIAEWWTTRDWGEVSACALQKRYAKDIKLRGLK